MIIWKRPDPSDVHLQEAGSSNNYGDGQKEEKKEKEKEEKEKKLLRAGGRTDGQTDKPIKGSTRGPRGPKNEKNYSKFQNKAKIWLGSPLRPRYR